MLRASHPIQSNLLDSLRQGDTPDKNADVTSHSQSPPFRRPSSGDASAENSSATFLDVLPVACSDLRSYQREQLGAVSACLHQRVLRLLVQLPTGGGKTHEIGAVVLAAQLFGLRVLVLAPRTRLVRQICERLDAYHVPYGVIAAAMPRLTNATKTVQVASADTLYRRCLVDKRRPMPPADLVIFDEAHLSVANSRLALLDWYPDAVRLGFTATPARQSGRGLSAAFDQLIIGPSISELMALKQLVRPRIFNTPIVTVEELQALPKDAANDYAPTALGDCLSRPTLIGDVVENWLRNAHGLRTIVFAVTKSHGAHLRNAFCHAGIATELLTADNIDSEREAAIGRLERGQTSVLINCFLLSYGVDIPTVDCIVLARPTRSIAMYLQMIGRGLRPAADKHYCIVIDHGHVVESLGLPTSDFRWSLDEKRNVNKEVAAAMSRKSATEKPRTCAECSNMWLVSETGPVCDQCGWRPVPSAKVIAVEDADLAEINASSPAISLRSPEVLQFFREALDQYARLKPDRWQAKPARGRWCAWMQTRERFAFRADRAPSFVWDAQPVTTSRPTAGWLKSRQIAWAKRGGKPA